MVYSRPDAHYVTTSARSTTGLWLESGTVLPDLDGEVHEFAHRGRRLPLIRMTVDQLPLHPAFNKGSQAMLHENVSRGPPWTQVRSAAEREQDALVSVPPELPGVAEHLRIKARAAPQHRDRRPGGEQHAVVHDVGQRVPMRQQERRRDPQ